jgi:hypothetical protein
MFGCCGRIRPQGASVVVLSVLLWISGRLFAGALSEVSENTFGRHRQPATQDGSVPFERDCGQSIMNSEASHCA